MVFSYKKLLHWLIFLPALHKKENINLETGRFSTRASGQKPFCPDYLSFWIIMLVAASEMVPKSQLFTQEMSAVLLFYCQFDSDFEGTFWAT